MQFFKKFSFSFSNHWRGRETLLSAFLKYFLLGNILFLVTLAVIHQAFVKLIKHTPFESHWNFIAITAPWLVLAFFLITLKIIWSCSPNIKYKTIHFLCKGLIIVFIPTLSWDILKSEGYLATSIYLPDHTYPQTYSEVLSIIDKSWITPRRIIVDVNGGGNIESAIAIAEKMRALNMDIEVKRFCASACANYLFPAATNKFLHKNAIIMYHGNFSQENLKENVPNNLSKNQTPTTGQSLLTDVIRGTPEKEVTLTKTSDHDMPYLNQIRSQWGFPLDLSIDQAVQHLIKKEEEFYATIQVDKDIAAYGQRGNYLEIYKSYQYDGFYYSPDDMTKMGVSNIQLVDGSWHPEENQEVKRFYLVKLNEK